MASFQQQQQKYIKHEEIGKRDSFSMEEKQSIDAVSKLAQMMDLPDKDF